MLRRGAALVSGVCGCGQQAHPHMVAAQQLYMDETAVSPS